MNQLALFQKEAALNLSDKNLLRRATGCFYTHALIAEHLAEAICRSANLFDRDVINVVEPFCGDGRLICKLLETFARVRDSRRLTWRIQLWDCEASSIEVAKENIQRTVATLKMKAQINGAACDSFSHALDYLGQFDICVTNPPWEVLKPDRREMVNLSIDETTQYIRLLREKDAALTSEFPLSTPLRKFSGWGINLARCGVELALRLLSPHGVCGVVSPASLLADQMSERLRRWTFHEHKIHDIAYYAAEARLFEKVDQSSVTIVASAEPKSENVPVLSVYGRSLAKKSLKIFSGDWNGIKENGYILPIQFGISLLQMYSKWKHLPRVVDLEKASEGALWAGRELDETGHQRFLNDIGDYLFVKGRMIRRFGMIDAPKQYIKREGPRIPSSADFHRIAWRDVARPNQKRRMHATLIPPGWVTGNSLNVAYFRDNDLFRLKALLAVINSLVFEAQVRAHLATGHISLGAVRQVRIPLLSDKQIIKRLAGLVDRCMKDDPCSLIDVEIAVARLYEMTKEDFSLLLASFDKIEDREVSIFLSCKAWEES